MPDSVGDVELPSCESQSDPLYFNSFAMEAFLVDFKDVKDIRFLAIPFK